MKNVAQTNMNFRYRTIKVVGLIILTTFCFEIKSQNLVPKTKTIELGKTKVELKIYEQSGSERAFVHIHENETASLEAGLNVLKSQGGKLVTLVHSFDGSKNRNVVFDYENTTYQFDPNRIYSKNDDVLLKSISVFKGKGKVNIDVVKAVRNLADQIWNEVASSKIIVALHNIPPISKN